MSTQTAEVQAAPRTKPVGELVVDDTFICPPSVYSYAGLELTVSKIQYAAGFKRIVTCHLGSGLLRSSSIRIRMSETTPVQLSS